MRYVFIVLIFIKFCIFDLFSPLKNFKIVFNKSLFGFEFLGLAHEINLFWGKFIGFRCIYCGNEFSVHLRIVLFSVEFRVWHVFIRYILLSMLSCTSLIIFFLFILDRGRWIQYPISVFTYIFPHFWFMIVFSVLLAAYILIITK